LIIAVGGFASTTLDLSRSIKGVTYYSTVSRLEHFSSPTQASFSQTPLLENKLIMQLRTILISTGILAFVTSFTSGGPTPAIPAAGPGKRTNVNRNVGSVQVDISPNDDGQVFNQNDPISFIGYDERLEGRKPGAYTWIDVLIGGTMVRRSP
jgi:hypothetical protein